MAAPRSDVVLDANALVALLRHEASAATVERLLRAGRARMSSVNAAETIDVLIRRYAWPPDDVARVVDPLFRSVVDPVPPSLEHAIRAGELRARHWRRDQRISLADCFVLATVEPGVRIATLDRTLAAVAREEGYEVVELG